MAGVLQRWANGELHSQRGGEPANKSRRVGPPGPASDSDVCPHSDPSSFGPAPGADVMEEEEEMKDGQKIEEAVLKGTKAE